MTKTILALSLLFSLPLFAASPSADYNLTIHVSESRIGTGRATDTQDLCVLVDGVKYEMESLTSFPKGIVALGDYKAKWSRTTEAHA